MTAFAALRSNRLLPALLTGLIVGSLLPARPARADSGPSPSPAGPPGSYDTALGVPETGASVANGNHSPVSVDPSTGIARASIPFSFPRARGRSQPILDVSYSSAAGAGIGGYGWSLNTASVVRTPLSGPPTYADPAPGGALDPSVEDRFSFEGSALVPICHIPDAHCSTGSTTPYYAGAIGNESLPAFTNTGGWTYFRKETGADDVRLFWSGDHHTWVAQFKTGETLEMGHPLASDASGGYFGDAIDWDHDDTTKAFRWSLVRQYDSELKNGVPVNRILYSWMTIAGALYLTDIFYTILAGSAAQYPSPPSAFAYHIRLAYDTSRWAPAVPTLVDPIWHSPAHLLLSHVDVTAASDVASAAESSASSVSRRLVRRYWLNHTSDADYLYSARTLLSSVQVEGRCAVAGTDGEGADFSVSPTTNCDRLEPTTYTYTPTLVPAAWWSLNSASRSPAGLAGPGAFTLQSGVTNYPGQFFYDANSDGIPDLIVPVIPSNGGAFSTGAYVHYTLGNGTAFTGANAFSITYPTDFVQNSTPNPAAITYSGTPLPGQSTPGNFGGDGKLDLLITGNYGRNAIQFALLTPGTNSFAPVSSPFLPVAQTTYGDSFAWVPNAETPIALVDVDGDGYIDALNDTQLDSAKSDWWQALTLRSTVASPDGTIEPFANTKPNSISAPPPPYTAVTSGLPTAGQYFALLHVAASTSSPPPFQNLDARLFQFGSNGGPTPLVLFADMNGDGLVDWVTIDNTGGNLLYWVGHGDGTFGSCSSGRNDCTGAARFEGTSPATAFAHVPTFPSGSMVMLHDVNGDGYDDLIVMSVTPAPPPAYPGDPTYPTSILTVYLNEAGHDLDTSGTLVASHYGLWEAPGVPGTNQAPATFGFGDMNGSGSDDLIVNFEGTVNYFDFQDGVRPGLLTTISNGYGATTTIDYASTTQLQDTAAGAAWTTSSPQILHHVVDVKSTNGMPAPFTESREVDYSYQNPIYDGRDREFVGFQKVTAKTIGDANEPSMTTQTTFLSGTCFDIGNVACPAVANDVDRPMLTLRGLPVLEDVFDDAGHHVSTTHTTYTVRNPMTGTDRRGVRFAYPSTVDTFLYDSSAVLSPTASPVSLSEVTYTDEPSATARSRLVTLAAPAGSVAQTETRRVEDINGNTVGTVDAGVMAGAGTAVPHGGSYDSPIAFTSTWVIPSGDPTQFQWRPTLMTRAAFATPAGITAPADVAASASFSYRPDGLPSSVSVTALGEASLVRASGGAPSPSTAVGNGAMVGTSDFYDAFGNLTAEVSSSGATCTGTDYDAPFAQFATSQSSYRDGCSSLGVPTTSAAIVTSQAWDRGFERPTLKIAANASTSTYTYDSFGRLATMSLPDPITGAPSTPPTVTVRYYDSVQSPLLDTGYPVKERSVGIFNGASGTQLSWSYSDAWDQPLAHLVPADTFAGDGATWIVRDQTLRSARGATIKAYAPYFWMNGSDASRFPFNALPTVTISSSTNSVTTPALVRTVPIAATSASYDAFGRVTRTVGLDGATATATYSYHVLEEDVQDAEQQLGGSHGGASSYQIWDGHNRAVRAGQLFYDPVAKTFDERVQSTVYTSGGLPWILRQTHSTDTTVVQRTMQYDSLGRLVANLEPNTSTSGSGFRYVYDADGRLVGTSDDNGCGENIAYDGIGRRVWEDYSPCTSAQPAYTPAPTSWSNKNVASTTGVETFYAYDHSPTLLDNQLSSEYSRGETSSFTYDARSRVTNVSRVLGAPTWSSVGSLDTSSNYGSHAFTRMIQYDALNRVIGESTGADVPELLGADVLGTGQTKSFVSATYSQRGVISSIQGSYGTLVRSNVLDADGAPLTRVYGDPAGTTEFQCYDGLRHVSEAGVYRNAAHPACAHYALNPPTTTTATAQTTLIDDVYTRDKVGNPLAIADNRTPGEWTAGSMPVNRAMTPDDAYRVNKVTYAYATSSQTDVFVSPLLAKPVAAQSPMEPIASGVTRVAEQDYSYDWLGNTTWTNDDQNVFFERSLQTVSNGTATKGPNRLNSAGTPITFLDGTSRGEKANVSYDNAGNVTGIVAFVGDETCYGHCTLNFAFDWDELGRMMHARRFDDGAATAAADVHYVYDASGNRVLRAALEGTETLYSAQVFPSLRLDGAQWESTDYQRDATTESAYLTLGGETFGRVLYTAPENVTPAVPSQHVFLMMGDALGSTTAVIDSSTSQLVERMTYYPFGGVESEYRSPSWGNFSESYKYTGKEDDAEVGVTYFGARFYSRFLGRWLSPDPLAIHGAAGDPNPYAFVHGAPFRFVDPTGLDGCDNLSPGCGNGTPIPVSGDAQAAAQAAGWVAKEARAAEQWVSKALRSAACWVSHCGPSAPPPPPPSTAVRSTQDPFRGLPTLTDPLSGLRASAQTIARLLTPRPDQQYAVIIPLEFMVDDPALAAAEGFSSLETSVVNEVKNIPLAQLRAAFEAGGAELNIGGRTILVDPGVPSSGFTLFGENGFVVGQEAFASDAELTKTLLHETFRLASGQAASGATQAEITVFTEAASTFAERAFGAFF